MKSIAEFGAMFWGTFTAVTFSMLLYPLVKRIAGRPLWVAVPVALLGLTVIAILQMAGDYAGQFAIHHYVDAHRMPDYSPYALQLTSVIYGALSACNIALLCIAGAARRIRTREVELARSQVAALKAELKQLQMQLNPHFLGNSLNAISALILEQRYSEANATTERLADFFHAVMRADSSERSLRDEIGILRGYLSVEMLRFEDRLAVTIDVDPELQQASVPSLILQPLVENAIRHGVERTQGAVSLRVEARRDANTLLLEVTNRADTPAGDSASKRGHGIGLANTRSRLALLFGADASLATDHLPDGYRVVVRLPLLLLPDTPRHDTLA